MKSNSNPTFAQGPKEKQLLFEHNGYTAELCLDLDSLQTAFRLRYQSYHMAGALQKDEQEAFFDAFDAQENTFTHLIWYEGQAVGTVRSHLHVPRLGWEQTESSTLFPDVAKTRLGKQAAYLESNRYAVSHLIQGRESLKVQMLLFRIHALCSAVFECEHILTIVRAKHLPFYQRFLAFDLMTEERLWYEPMQSEIILLCAEREASLQTALGKGLVPYETHEVASYATLVHQKKAIHKLDY